MLIEPRACSLDDRASARRPSGEHHPSRSFEARTIELAHVAASRYLAALLAGDQLTAAQQSALAGMAARIPDPTSTDVAALHEFWSHVADGTPADRDVRAALQLYRITAANVARVIENVSTARPHRRAENDRLMSMWLNLVVTACVRIGAAGSDPLGRLMHLITRLEVADVADAFELLDLVETSASPDG